MGEAQAAYHIDVDFGRSQNWVVIHDLRVEHDGLVAQIDHLLINRLLDLWVLESKRFAGGIKINERGECLTFAARKPIAVDSPIEQNRRHMKILQAMLDVGAVRLPTRLGRPLKPKIRSLVLISAGLISRPRTPVPGIETVIKSDQVRTTIERTGDNGNPLELMKIVSSETLVELGEQICALHRPIQFDWEKRLGLDEAPTQPDPVAPPRREYKITVESAPRAEPEVLRAQAKVSDKPARSAEGCAGCGCEVSRGVRAYCKTNHERFGGAIYCMACQKGVGAPR